MLLQLIEDRLPAASRRVAEVKEKRTVELKKLLGTDFQVGDTNLLARYKGVAGSKHFRCQLLKINEDGTFRIKYLEDKGTRTKGPQAGEIRADLPWQRAR